MANKGISKRMKKLEEIRTDFTSRDLKIENRLNTMSHSIGVIYNNYGDIYYGGNNIILIYFKDINKGIGLKHNISPPVIGVDTTKCYFDLEFFFTLNDLEQKRYLLELIHKALLSFFNHFGFDTTKLEEAYNRTKKSNFYYKDKKVLSKDKSVALFLEYTYNYNVKVYRVVIEELMTHSFTYINLCQKEYFFGNEHPEISFEDLMKTPMFLDEKGWISDDEYCYTWGAERYIISIFKKQLVVEK